MRGRRHPAFGEAGDDALFRSILLPMLSWTAERCGGFDWQDEAFESAYLDFEQTLFGTARTYVALAPVVGLSAGNDVELGEIRLRPIVAGEISQLWPEARGLMPPEFGRDVDRLLVLELHRELAATEAEPPDAAAELADAVTALRLATAGAIAAGPVVFERLDFRPLRVSPILPIAATQPRGEPTRLDKVRAKLAADLRERLPLADEDRELGEALDRWELSLFSEEPFRSAQVRESLTCLLGGDGGLWAAAMRASVLLTEKTRDRAELLDSLREEKLRSGARDAVRRVARRDAAAREPARAGRGPRRDDARPAGATRVVAPRRMIRRSGGVRELARRRHSVVRFLRLPSIGWRKQTGFWSGSLASNGSSEGRLRRQFCSTSFARLSARQRRGHAPKATIGQPWPCRNFGREQKECAEQNRSGVLHGTRTLAPAS